jgi:hypothetical protein
MPGRKTLTAVAGLVALATMPALALSSPERATSNTVTYPDSVGEDAQSPDITSTTVSNDDSGLITFHIAISNRPALTDDMLIAVLVDTDQNAATGDTKSLTPGNDYLVQLISGSVDLFSWSNTDYKNAAAPSLVYSYDATGATIKINATDLGQTKGFNFAVVALSGLVTDATGNPDFTNIHRDTSPDPGHGAFTYQVKITVTLSATAFTTSPKPPKAGRPFSAGLAATESDTGGAVQQGTVTCVARVGGKVLRPRTTRIVNGIAVCLWTLPKTASGKRVAGSVTLTAQGATITRSFSQKIT